MRAVPRLPDDELNVSKRHPLGEAAWLVVGLGLVVALLYGIVAWSAETVAAWIPVSVEVELFQTVADQLPLWSLGSAPAETRGLAALSSRLASHWPEDPYRHRLLILDEPSLNAVALPGGAILVTRGLLNTLETENELAFALAHELGHFRHRDHLLALGRSVLFQLLLATLGLGDIPARGIVQASGEVLARTYTRDQERAADRFALQLMDAEYGHIAGATRCLERLGSGGLAEIIASTVGSHPGASERITDVLETAQRRGYAVTGEQRPLLRLSDG